VTSDEQGSGAVNQKQKTENRKFKVPPQIATLIFAVGIAGLFWLDRDKTARPSKALWLAVIWLATTGSRPVSEWLGMSMTSAASGSPVTSPLDQAIAGSLMLLGVAVLIRRRADAAALLRASWPIALYFSFALVSLSWSDYPEWGFKRWVRALGDAIMVLIIVTDAHPAAALRRLFSRLGFVLLPASVLFIKYYPQLGRGFSEWGDGVVNLGVASSKNMLGLLAFVLALGVLWQVLGLLRDRNQPDRRRRLLAQGTLLAFCIDLLFAAGCATCGTCFVLGAGLMLLTARPTFRVRPAAVHALVLAILLGGGLTDLLGGEAAAARALGRNPTLSMRTIIWKNVIPLCPNPIGGAGFETFWVGPRYNTFLTRMIADGAEGAPTEAHNGYIEVYLQLGWIGLGLIALILGHGYRKAVAAIRRDPALGALLVAYVVTAVTYNITEAGFRMLDLEWFFLILAIVAASRVISLDRAASESGRELADHSPGNLDVLDLNPTWMESCRPLVLRDTAGA
jgi:exopolysaccharide production protein ExoQ